MIIRFTEENDLEKWKVIAKNVGEVFGHPTMYEYPKDIDFAEKRIIQKEAFIAVDDTNKDFFGYIWFSRCDNKITWLGVLQKYRNRGIGSKLLKMALNEYCGTSSNEAQKNTITPNN